MKSLAWAGLSTPEEHTQYVYVHVCVYVYVSPVGGKCDMWRSTDERMHGVVYDILMKECTE